MGRKKELFLNFFVGIISQVIILLFGFVVPKIILNSYGSDVNGLTSSITQVFSYIALLEAGIGLATRNALFKPINDKDEMEISSILSATQRYYRKVTLIYSLAVLALAFILPIAFRTEVDYWTIFFVVIFEGLTSVVNFYFTNTKICFLNTYGKTYVVNIVELLSKVACYTIKIILALSGMNIALIQLGFFAVSIIKSILIEIYMRKKFGWINFKVKDAKLAKIPDKGAFLITEIAWTIFSSTDMIVISIFISTKLSSVYSVYNLIYVSIALLITSVYNSLSYVLGKTYHEDIEKYKKLHNIFTSFIMTITTILICVAYWLTLPFVKLYTADVTDIDYIYKYLPLLFCMVQMLSWSRYVSGNLTSVAGYAKITCVVSVIEALINIALSLIFINFFDIYGVLLATVIALPLK
ncbi:MAG: polysaccharide biosynthesis C-terminal domain-containing protein, partial [Acholeplasmatales bacterium]|nr:polysaccharide biosynthesis C-terminal domain-containing protein [Acholeplasmatales bacterium]